MNSLVIASTFAALLAGSGIAKAQVVDSPPGSVFQNQGMREEAGHPRFGEPVRSGVNARAGYVLPTAYDWLPSASPQRYQASIRRRHNN